jgi:hypothetical protein
MNEMKTLITTLGVTANLTRREMTKLKLNEEQLAEYFDEVLDEGDKIISIAGYNFTPSQILKNCDPTAYRCEKANFANTLTDCGYEIEGY